MIEAVTNSPSGWLIPGDSEASVDRRVRMLACGNAWDALRTPENLALPVVVKLLGRRTDRNQLGPVLHNGITRTVYWLVTPGHTDTWPEDCVLLGANHWITVPNPANAHRKLTWLHMPPAPTPTRAPTFTPPLWLAVALADQAAATEPHLGEP
jgi:hypothetical protein